MFMFGAQDVLETLAGLSSEDEVVASTSIAILMLI